MSRIPCVAAFAALFMATAAGAVDIRIVPASVIANPANASRGYQDLVVHAVAIRAGENERISIGRVTIELMRGAQPLLAETIGAEQLVQRTGQLMPAPLPLMIGGQLLNRQGLTGLFGAPTTAAGTAQLAPRQALVTTRDYNAVQGEPDSVRVRVYATGANGETLAAERSAPIVVRRSPIVYRSPLRGAWLMQAGPTLQSHHRLNPSTEFALDFFKVDAEGRMFQGDPLTLGNFYGNGAEVSAAADGEVVLVNDGEIQDRAAMIRRPDESPQAAGERIGAYNMRRMAANFERAAAGNLVVIRHERDGVTEYSSYGHLRRGIPVRAGQRVTQGQVIGHVGDTGDSPAVHLHFQVNAGPDPFATQSLPIRFEGLRSAAGNSELGRFVVAE